MLEIELLLIALGHSNSFTKAAPTDKEWKLLYRFAVDHGLIGLLYSGVERLPKEQQPEKQLLIKWYMQTVFIEKMYRKHMIAIANLASFYKSHKIDMMLFKGYGVSLFWPNPVRRPVGDIDTYNFGLWKEADSIVSKELGIKISDSHEHHTVFYYEGCMVENHYDIVNTKSNKFGAWIDSELKKLAEDKKSCKIEDSEIFLPSATFNVVFLLRHLGQHFSGERIIIRQLLDWAFFMQKDAHNIDWSIARPSLEKMGLISFFNHINAVCVNDLGFADFRKFSWYDEESVNKELAERIFNDIIHPEFSDTKPDKGTFYIIAFKIRRFFANSWKRKLIYKESLLSNFLYGSAAHLKRFSSING